MEYLSAKYNVDTQEADCVPRDGSPLRSGGAAVSRVNRIWNRSEEKERQRHALMPPMSAIRIPTAVAALVLLSSTACGADSRPSGPEKLDMAWLQSQGISVPAKLVSAQRVSDNTGEHVLVLARKNAASPSRPTAGRSEYIELTAVYYQRTATAPWRQEWTIRDFTDCPGLDSAGDFFVNAIAFTDLNGDGRLEVTVPYHLFCGGGIEPRTVKVILRDGATKLAIRGESIIRLPGQEPFGGEHQYDKALLQPDRAKYKAHLDSVWKLVAAEQPR